MHYLKLLKPIALYRKTILKGLNYLNEQLSIKELS